MAIILTRQLSDDEKEHVLKRDGRKCYATGHEIPEGDTVHFDHIWAFSLGGGSYVDNVAPMCEYHNKAKGRLPLEDFRIKLRLKDFFKLGDRLTLGNLLYYLKSQGDIQNYGLSVVLNEQDSEVEVESALGKNTYNLYMCPNTKWKYFYATLPVELLDSDDESNDDIGLQPRYLIFDKVFNMYRHFQVHPVLQPSLGRLTESRFKLFDGQHKAAALLWTKRTEFECKIYINCDPRKLNQTNIAAHDKFAQTRFYSSIMVMKLGTQFGKDFEEYKNSEEDPVKSEEGFFSFLKKKEDEHLTAAELNKRFRSYLFNSVLDPENNKCCELLSASNRSTDEKPLTIDMLNKSIFTLMYREPLHHDMAREVYKRDQEVSNIIALMNMIYDNALSNWNPKASKNDSTQRKLSRIFRSKSIMAWSVIFRDAILAKLDLIDADDRQMPLYRELSNDELSKIEAIVKRAVSWQGWAATIDSEIDIILSASKSEVKDWLRAKGFTSGYLLGAPE